MTSAASAPGDVGTPAVRIAFEDVTTADGTVVEAWTNDPDGVEGGAGIPTVVLCNGLGTNAWAWPALLRPDCGVRVLSWHHRGVGGSQRPVDPERVGVADVVEDAVAVMDHFGVERAAAMGWSMGVNTMFELATRHPERVSGLFAVCGVPGDTFATMLGPARLPLPVARALSVGATRLLRGAGPALTPLASRLPVGPRTVAALGRTGFMFDVPDRELAARAVSEFLQTPLDWYFHLALRASEHDRVPLSGIEVPTTFVAARWDVLAGSRLMESAAARMREATFVELEGSHFVQMEQPEVVHALLLQLLERTR